MQPLQNFQPDTWYVQVGGQAYGPYTSEQMQGFCAEGRVTEQSIISQSPSQGYANASKFQSFLHWKASLNTAAQITAPTQSSQVLRPISSPDTGVLARQITPQASPQIRPQPQAHAQPMTPQISAPHQHHLSAPQPAAAQNSGSLSVFIVMAEIRSANGMAFLKALQAQGTAQRIGDSVWLLRSQISVEQLRNTLSQTMTGDDRLFLLDSFANKTAWFNIGTNMDAKIRELWDLNSALT